MTSRSKLRDYFHVEYQPGERKLVQKIDFFILTFCCLSYFTNYVSIPRLAFFFPDKMLDGAHFLMIFHSWIAQT